MWRPLLRADRLLWPGPVCLKQLIATIAVYDENIDALAREHPDYSLVKSLPGADQP
jgi:hypothetical protein